MLISQKPTPVAHTFMAKMLNWNSLQLWKHYLERICNIRDSESAPNVFPLTLPRVLSSPAYYCPAMKSGASMFLDISVKKQNIVCLSDFKAEIHSATSRSVCTTCKTSRCDTKPLRCTRSDLVWGGMRTSFLNQYGGPHDALSLVHLYFVAAICCRKCTHVATALRSVARIQTGLNSCNWSQRQNSAAATMIFTKLTVSHEANCCSDLSPSVSRPLIGTLRSTTATLTKTSLQNITLHYRKFLEVRPSRSRRTMWAKCPKNKLARAVSE